MLQALQFLAPALLLVVLLLNRRYPGERMLTRRYRRWRGLARASATARRYEIQTVAVRGGQLIGRSLAVRAPPALAV